MNWFMRKPNPSLDWYVLDPQADMTAEELVLILKCWPDAPHFGVTFEAGYTPNEHLADTLGRPEIARHLKFVPETTSA